MTESLDINCYCNISKRGNAEETLKPKQQQQTDEKNFKCCFLVIHLQTSYIYEVGSSHMTS